MGGGGGVGLGGVRVDVIEELKFLGKFKKKMGGGPRGRGGGQGGCERRIEANGEVSFFCESLYLYWFCFYTLGHLYNKGNKFHNFATSAV